MKKILLVDDELGLLEMLGEVLRKGGYTSLDFATTSKKAIDLIGNNEYDLILLDVMLPDMDGFQLCAKIRETSNVPILFLTAKITDLDILTGLNIGGDDYILKPFNPLEVLARVKAHLRRTERNQNSNHLNTYDYGDLKINPTTAQVFLKGKEIPFTAKELQIIVFFCGNPNKIFSINSLYENVWGNNSFGDTNTVMVYINRIRKKIEKNPNHPELIINIRGLGYKFIPPKEGSNYDEI